MSSTSPIVVVLDQEIVAAAHAAGENAWWLYCTEVLDHLRLPYTVIGPEEAAGRLATGDVVAVYPHEGRLVTSAGETAFDPGIWQRIVEIQQGVPVEKDGTPAPDGSSPVDDGLLKCDDGITLSYVTDRAVPPGEATVEGEFPHVYPPEAAPPMFHQAMADRLRLDFLALVFDAAAGVNLVLPWLHYWPAGVPAVAHMSHDSDGNVSEQAASGLDVFDQAGVKVTWCHCFPGGYTPEIVAEIAARGHEQALHYNAMGDADIASWGWPQLRAQYAWAQALTGRDGIVSNKNHYTRWEGWDEFFLWCERIGIQIDQSRGPSKQGNVGFPFGSCHLWFPIAGAAELNRRIDVLELPLHTQDLAWASHISIRDVILDEVLALHGVAHFLFHSAHLHTKPDVAEACRQVAAEARRRGMPWWTSEQLNSWERGRRGVQLAVSSADGELRVEITAEQAVKGAGVLLAVPGLAENAAFVVVSGAARASVVTRHGRLLLELAADLPAGTSSFTVRPTG
ncbi:hypothetical protein [Actinopolymorpha alba]|uniref:hypothetical protein n=1 Tax=Actinopolymorpha alba TaxID=533267 RepID=UPI000375FFC3|nr:hypothetical protein [Actinopolymorpha alba]